MVVLPWEEAKGLIGRLDPQQLPDFGKLRGRIVLGDWELLAGSRLSMLLRALPHLRV